MSFEERLNAFISITFSIRKHYDAHAFCSSMISIIYSSKCFCFFFFCLFVCLFVCLGTNLFVFLGLLVSLFVQNSNLTLIVNLWCKPLTHAPKHSYLGYYLENTNSQKLHNFHFYLVLHRQAVFVKSCKAMRREGGR